MWLCQLTLKEWGLTPGGGSYSIVAVTADAEGGGLTPGGGSYSIVAVSADAEGWGLTPMGGNFFFVENPK